MAAALNAKAKKKAALKAKAKKMVLIPQVLPDPSETKFKSTIAELSSQPLDNMNADELVDHAIKWHDFQGPTSALDNLGKYRLGEALSKAKTAAGFRGFKRFLDKQKRRCQKTVDRHIRYFQFCSKFPGAIAIKDTFGACREASTLTPYVNNIENLIKSAPDGARAWTEPPKWALLVQVTSALCAFFTACLSLTSFTFGMVRHALHRQRLKSSTHRTGRSRREPAALSKNSWWKMSGDGCKFLLFIFG